MVSNYEKNYELIGHLLRRASFGANKKEIDYAKKELNTINIIRYF